MQGKQSERDSVATAKHEASPEGLREFAAAKRAADEVAAAKLADGRTILEAKGFTAEDVQSLSDADVLRYSGVDPDAQEPSRGSAMPASSFVGG